MNEMRWMRAGMPATVPGVQCMNGRASREISALVPAASITLRAAGPATAIWANCSVRFAVQTLKSHHSVCSHSSIQPCTRSAPPVVVWQRKPSSPSRTTTPSSKRKPFSLHMRP